MPPLAYLAVEILLLELLDLSRPSDKNGGIMVYLLALKLLFGTVLTEKLRSVEEVLAVLMHHLLVVRAADCNIREGAADPCSVDDLFGRHGGRNEIFVTVLAHSLYRKFTYILERRICISLEYRSVSCEVPVVPHQLRCKTAVSGAAAAVGTCRLKRPVIRTDSPSASALALFILRGVILEHKLARLAVTVRNCSFKIIGKRTEKLCHVCIKYGPVVHLNIDIKPVACSPRSVLSTVPYTLKICGHASGTRAGDKQITSELEIYHLEIRYFLACKVAADKLGSLSLVNIIGRIKLELGARINSAVVGDMTAAQLRRSMIRHSGDLGLHVTVNKLL